MALFGWLLFGILVAVVVRVGVPPTDHHKTAQIVFYGLIVLAGPLVMLLLFVPTDEVRLFAQRLRTYLDAKFPE